MNFWSQNHDTNSFKNKFQPNSTKIKSTSKLHGFKNDLLYLWTSWSLKNEDLY